MTKRKQIETLSNQGLERKEIAKRVDTTLGYVNHILWGLKNPGKIEASQAKFRKEDGGEYNKRWRKNNPESWKKIRARLVESCKKATVPVAKNHYQCWTTHEIEHLEKHGGEKSIRQLALDLGRTHIAVQSAGHRYSIDLRGNKMGANASRFRGIYDELEHLEQVIAEL